MAIQTPTGWIEDGTFVEGGNGMHGFTESVVHDRNGYPPINQNTTYNFSVEIRLDNVYSGNPPDFSKQIIIQPTSALDANTLTSLNLIDGSSLTVKTFNIGGNPYPFRIVYQYQPGSNWNADWSRFDYSAKGFPLQGQPPFNGPIWMLAGKYGLQFLCLNANCNVYIIGIGGSKVLIASSDRFNNRTFFHLYDGVNFDTSQFLVGEPFWTIRLELSNVDLANPASSGTFIFFRPTKL